MNNKQEAMNLLNKLNEVVDTTIKSIYNIVEKNGGEYTLAVPLTVYMGGYREPRTIHSLLNDRGTILCRWSLGEDIEETKVNIIIMLTPYDMLKLLDRISD